MFVDGGQSIFSLNKLSAFHKAQWMSKTIFCIKLVQLENKILQEVPAKIFAKDQNRINYKSLGTLPLKLLGDMMLLFQKQQHTVI